MLERSVWNDFTTIIFLEKLKTHFKQTIVSTLEIRKLKKWHLSKKGKD